MKKSIMLGLGVCALALGGVAALVGQKGAVETKAEVPSEIYLKWTDLGWDDWGDDGVIEPEHIYAHFMDSEAAGITTWHGNANNGLVTVGSTEYIKYTVPSGAAGVVFNINYSDWSGDNNQTVDLTIPTDGKNLFVISSVGSGKASGNWYEFDKDVADGAYLRGVIGGVENWGSSGQRFLGTAGNNQDDILTTNFVSLSANDKVKVVIYHDGQLTKWLSIKSVDSADTGLYAVSNDGGNFKVASAAYYGFRLYYGTTSDGNEYWDYFAVTTGTEWADGFLDSMTCDPTGLTAPVFKKDGESWNTYATSYDALDSIAKDALYGAVGSDSGSAITRAAKRHDVIVAHHGYTAFMTNGEKSATRSPATAAQISSLNMANNTENGFVTIAIVVSAAALLGIGTLFIARKRRAE